MAYTTSPSHIAVLIIDKNHPKFGKIAKLSLHDWRESGDYHISFPGESMCLDDRTAGTVFVGCYRQDDDQGAAFDREERGPRALQKKFLEVKAGTLEELAREYKQTFREEMPRFNDIDALAAKLEQTVEAKYSKPN